MQSVEERAGLICATPGLTLTATFRKNSQKVGTPLVSCFCSIVGILLILITCGRDTALGGGTPWRRGARDPPGQRWERNRARG